MRSYDEDLLRGPGVCPAAAAAAAPHPPTDSFLFSSASSSSRVASHPNTDFEMRKKKEFPAMCLPKLIFMRINLVIRMYAATKKSHKLRINKFLLGIFA